MRLKRIFPKGVEVELKPTEEQLAAFEAAKPYLRPEFTIDKIMDVDRVERFDECLVEIQNSVDEWHVSPKLMDKGIAEGWMTVSKGRITLHTPEGDVDYAISAKPDRQKGLHYFDCRKVS